LTLLEKIIQAIIAGLTSGSVYTIVGIALAVVHNVTKFFDLSQGQYVMLGGMIACVFFGLGLPLSLSIPLAIAISLLAGLLIYRVVLYRPSQTLPHMNLILVTFGLSMFVQGVAFIVFGTDQRMIPYYLKISPIRVSAITISPQAPLIYGVLCLMVIGLYLLFGRTMLGKALRACHEQLVGARLMVINPKRMMYLAYALAVCLGAIGGTVMAPLTSMSFSTGDNLLMKGFLAALVGGIYSYPGVIAGGLALGILESIMAGFVSSAYASVLTLTIFLVVLLLRPTGILGSKEIRT
jgi:branched-chain amino acid transport system permease protein